MAKIAIVLHDLRGGGAEKMMVRLANQLAIMGDDVEMILLTGGGSNKAFLSDAVKLIELNSKRTLASFGPLRKQLKLSQPDAVLAALTHINVITSLVCLSLGWLKKLSVSERNTFSLDKKVNSNAVMRAAYILAPFIYRLLPNPVIAVSKGVADDLVTSTIVRQNDVVTAPNPVITSQTAKASEDAATHPWLVSKSIPIIISVGRLSYQKGYDMLLDAFYQVHKQLACRLIIFGEGELRSELEKQAESLGIEEDLSLPGYTDNPLAEIKHADLFVLSSRFEGSPNVLVEAMSVGTAVVAFDCPHGPKEILYNGKVAPLIEDKNVHQLALAMTQALTTERTAQQKQIQLKAIERFSSFNSAQHYRNLLLGNS